MLRWYRRYLERRAEERNRLADRQLDALRFRYHAFRNLLINNNDLLEQITRLESQLKTHRKGFPGLSVSVDKVLKLALDLVQNLNYLTPGSYVEIFGVLRRISSRLKSLAREIDPADRIPLICSLDETHPDLVAIVGGKAAPLGVLKNTLNLRIPEGFVVTTEACHRFLDQNGLIRPITDILRGLTPGDYKRLAEPAGQIRAMIFGARIPQDVMEAMEEAYEALLSKMGPGFAGGIAVRSSAIQEEGEHSFAGQFSTVLNVTSKRALLDAYKEVVASTFNEISLAYRLHGQLGFHENEMAVLCLVMVAARTAGTLYTVDPNDLGSERMILCSIWGLGEDLVNGKLPSDVFHISRLDTGRFEPVHLAKKELKLVCDSKHGRTRQEPVADQDMLRFSLDAEEIQTVCKQGLAVERYFGSPQDIEWAISQEGTVNILQTRTLHLRDVTAKGAREAFQGMKYIMERGTPASSGQAVGPVSIIRREQDVDSVAEGSIVVVRESIPKIASICGVIAGIILERGNPLEHLACVAREYGLPMLVRATDATQLLRDGQVVTVDAETARVYEGAANLPSVPRVRADRQREAVSDPRIRELRDLIFPLNLSDVTDPIFQMASCKSVHDIIRFCHEQGIQAMFEVNEGEYLKNKFYASRLDAPIAFLVDLINLGGGFSVPGHPRAVTPEEITSVPFLAFWKGVTHEGIRWSGPPARLNVKALGSVMSNTMLDAGRSRRPLGSRSYAMISRDYMNLNSRLAYHFAMVDTLCGLDATANYINFRFKGGGTSLERRTLRVEFIARILDSLGFFVNVDQDLLNATLKGMPAHALEEKLDMIGRLLGCARLLDMAMDNEETMEWFVSAFKSGNYTFEPYT